MNDSAFKTYGRELKHIGSMTDNDIIDDFGPYVDTNRSNHYNGGVGWDTKTIRNYWENRAKSGDKFSSEIYSKIYSHTNKNPKAVLAVEVGQLAYGIWKACNSRILKQDANKQSLIDQGIDLSKDYPIGSKIQNLKLKLTGFKTEYKPSYTGYGKGTTDHLIYSIDEITNIKFKIKIGVKDQVGRMLMQLFDKDTYGENTTFDLSSIQPIYFTVTGKVKNISPEYKTVSLNYAYLTSPSIEELDTLKNKLVADKQEKLEIEKAKMEATLNKQQKEQLEKIKNGLMTDDEEIFYMHNSEIIKMKFGILKDIIKSLKSSPDKFNALIDSLKNIR